MVLQTCCNTDSYTDNCILQFGVLRYPCPSSCLFTNPVLYNSVQQCVPTPCIDVEHVNFDGSIINGAPYEIPAGATAITIEHASEDALIISGGPIIGTITLFVESAITFAGPYDEPIQVDSEAASNVIITYTICNQ